MEFVLLPIGGAIIGIIASKWLENHTKTHGVIDVDHNTEQCTFRITSTELSDRKTKKAVFVINHDARISREEQSL